jgi:ion channel
MGQPGESTPAGGTGLTRQPGERWSPFAERIANAFGLVLLLVLATYVVASLAPPDSGWSAAVIAALGCSSATIALATAEARPSIVRVAPWLSAASVLLALIGATAGGRGLFAGSALIQVLLLSAAAVAVLRAVVTEAEVGFRTILGAISVYIILGLLFTFAYIAIAKLQSGDFFGAGTKPGRGDYVFFSVTTLTTTGYGNLVPAAQPGKLVAEFEMLTGQVFLVTLIARLVSLWQPGERLRQRGSDSDG